MARDDDHLFSGGDLQATIATHFNQALEKVNSIPPDQFMATDNDTLVRYITSDTEVHGIQLREAAQTMIQEETLLDASQFVHPSGLVSHYGGGRIPGTRVVISIPFEGDPLLWKTAPTSQSMSFTIDLPPRGNVIAKTGELGGILQIIMEAPANSPPEAFKQHYDQSLGSIRRVLEQQNDAIDAANKTLPDSIRKIVEERRSRLERLGAVRKVLNIPLARRPGSPELEQIPIKRKLVRPLPAAPSARVEFGIRDEDFEHILAVIRHEGRTFETTPATYAGLGEEEMRNIILAHLNGHYQGDATGEAFRAAGKTDIRIESENRAAFVAECKIWHGQEQLVKALEQLLGYVTWRDCKIALIVFNKEVAAFTRLQETLSTALKSHPFFLGEIATSQAGEWRFTFRSKSDPDRHVTIQVFLFDLHVPHKKSSQE